MKPRHLWKSALLVLATSGTLLPGSIVTAASDLVVNEATVTPETTDGRLEKTESPDQASQRPALGIQDVSLGEKGELTGYVLDDQGKPVAGSKVVVRLGRKIVAETTADKAGHFEVSGLRGGIYQIEYADGISVLRVWKHGTAPKSAAASARLVAEKLVIRGQSELGTLTTLQPLTVVSMTAAVVGGTVGIVGVSPASRSNDKADAATARLDAMLATFN